MIPRPLDPDERIDWLRLARTDSVGPVTFAHLIARYGDPSAAIAALPALARRGGRADAPRVPTSAEARRELEAGAAMGARLIASDEPDFPFGLRALDPPPPVLWVLGDAALLRRNLVAVVGARIASTSGRRFAQDLAAGLGAAGWVVVSGMARGIDAAAHRGSLDTGAVAVLGGGVDDIYPPEHGDLHEALRRRGCIVSERPIGSGVRASDFPRRNRIISGLSRGVVVVEAELRSGSLITARLAAEQGREVFAVPGSPLDPRARGTNDLIRQGATLVEDAADVLRVLETLPGFAEDAAPAPALAGEEDPKRTVTTVTNGAESLHERLEALLSPAPTAINALAREAGAPVGAVLAALAELAVAGRVELASGNLAIRL
jgi:DNA processing protein